MRYPNFKSLTIADLSILKERLEKHNPKVCELAFANLIIWHDFDHAKYTFINDNLCILISPVNEPPFYLEPIGKHKLKETVDICLKDTGRLNRISEEFIFRLNMEDYHIKCDRNQFDYVYETKALAELKGKKYDGKRNHIKGFQKRHPGYRVIGLSGDLGNEALALFEEWFKARKQSRHFPKLAYDSQKSALTNAFKDFAGLSFIGSALYLDNQLKGFVMGSPLNNKTIDVHFLYAHPSVKGIFQVLLWEASKETFKKYDYLNLEQDLGIPGLRKAKLSNQPIKLEKKFEISLKT
ncbi:MAG: phosphatidylglycerol lysyltransferase domain-containing protein [bacterium]